MPQEHEERRAIRRVKQANEDALLERAGVTGVDIDYKVTGGQQTDQLSIVVYVEEKKDVPARQRIPEEIDGIPTDVVEEKIIPHQMGAGTLLDDIQPAVDTTTYTPLKGGISIGPCRSFHLTPPEVPTEGDYVFVGTLGCIVRDRATGNHMMLSNFHVMCVDDTWAVGDDIAQPSRVDTGQCPRDFVGELQRAQLNQDVDCAVASISGRADQCEIVDIGAVNGTATAAVDMLVRKRGRTTELTNGKITSIDYTTSVDYGDGLGVVTLKNQIRIVPDGGGTFFGKKGDSGSVVVDGSGNVVGLYFAGNTTGSVGVANPIQKVLDALNVDVCTGLIKKKLEHKEFVKEYIEKQPWQEKAFRGKELFKDWKEWAYEKFDFEGKTVAFENQPWGQIPVDPWQFQFQPRTPFGAAEEMTPAGDVTGACIELGSQPVGPVPNPYLISSARLTKRDYGGVTPPQGRIVQWGAVIGWDCGYTAEIALRGCPMVGVTIAHFSRPPTVEAYNADGTLAGSVTTSPVQMTPQTVWFVGTSITRVIINCPANETLLLRICCCKQPDCAPKLQKEHKELPKELLPKELQPKELKEQKEPKEIKEKEIAPKEFQPKELFETGRPPIAGGAPDAGHFIPPDLRPDLGRGALRGEPDNPCGC